MNMTVEIDEGILECREEMGGGRGGGGAICNAASFLLMSFPFGCAKQ